MSKTASKKNAKPRAKKAQPRPVGRPSNLDKKTTDKYCEALRIGSPHQTASAYAGVHYKTALLWRNLGEEERTRIENGQPPNPDMTKYLEFFDAVTEAGEERRLNWLGVVNNAALLDPDWAWRMLMNDAPEHFRPPSSRTELTGAGGKDLNLGRPQMISRIVVNRPAQDEAGSE